MPDHIFFTKTYYTNSFNILYQVYCSQQSGVLVLDDLGLLGNAGNRVQQAEAISLFIHDRIEFGNWTLTPGLRYEDIRQDRTRYEYR